LLYRHITLISIAFFAFFLLLFWSGDHLISHSFALVSFFGWCFAMSIHVRYIERALFIGRWNDEMPTSENSVVSKYAKEVINGSFRSVLTSSHAQSLFTLRPSWNIDQQLETWFDWSCVFDGLTSEEGELLRLIFAIACLHSFIQANWTGPDLDVKPLDVLVFPPLNSDPPPEEVLNQKAISELAYGGEPAYHLARIPVFLRIADLLLSTCTYEQCSSAVWWRLRTWLVREQVLDEPVTLPSEVLSSSVNVKQSFVSFM
jgi:hypothetical protein